MENKINSENKCINESKTSLSMTEKIKIIQNDLKDNKKCFKHKTKNSNIRKKISIKTLSSHYSGKFLLKYGYINKETPMERSNS